MDTIKQTINQYNLISKKSLGQNFILDENITDKIVRNINVKNKVILEIGPGPGCLTRSLIKSGIKKIIAVEKDLNCIKILNDQKNFFSKRLNIIKGDFLEKKILNKTLKKLYKYKKNILIVSNLPYKTAIPILSIIYKNRDFFDELLLMFQTEQANRIIANKNTKNYGRITVLSNWLCKINKVMNLSPNYFFPKPKINSSLLKFKFKKEIKEVKDENLLIELIKKCFNQRRKTIKNNLKKIIPNIDQALLLNKINSKKRPEELDYNNYIDITNYIYKNKIILKI